MAFILKTNINKILTKNERYTIILIEP